MESRTAEKQLLLLKTKPNYSQTTIDEIKACIRLLESRIPPSRAKCLSINALLALMLTGAAVMCTVLGTREKKRKQALEHWEVDWENQQTQADHGFNITCGRCTASSLDEMLGFIKGWKNEQGICEGAPYTNSTIIVYVCADLVGSFCIDMINNYCADFNAQTNAAVDGYLFLSLLVGSTLVLGTMATLADRFYKKNTAAYKPLSERELEKIDNVCKQLNIPSDTPTKELVAKLREKLNYRNNSSALLFSSNNLNQSQAIEMREFVTTPEFK